MKKFLPILLFIIFVFFHIGFSLPVFAVDPTPTPPPVSGGEAIVPEGAWQEDRDVTFAGKLAARASKTLDWVLANTDWVEAGNSDSIGIFWSTIRNVVYIFLVFFVLVTAFILIITRGKSIAARRFLPRFLFAAILITLSFSLVQFLYQFTDFIQRMFLRFGDSQIQASDLLNISFDYETFRGFRKLGFQYEESAFISLLLVKATAVTFYVMAGILIVRKVILWFFIAVSPIFPLLLFYYPLRNSAKVWIGEFFRWLLYGPLFAIFLFALVSIWKNGSIPLFFGPDTNPANKDTYKNCESDQWKIDKIACYPVAINILLGGPGQLVGYGEQPDSYQNSVNSPSRFGLYVVALIMLWIVIILPFILLQIFLDYFFSYASSESSIINKIINKGSTILKPPPAPIPPSPTSHGIARVFSPPTQPVTPVPPLPSPPTSTGMAREIPRQEFNTTQNSNLTDIRSTQGMLNSINVAVPTIRDIARFETSTITNNIQNSQRIADTHETLERIANPNVIQNPIERQRFVTLKNTLVKQQEAGNPLAHAILSAANTTSKTTISTSSDSIKTSSTQTASSKEQVLDSTGKPMAKPAIQKQAGPTQFPVANRVQSVNLEDYEAVKKLWQENYQKLDGPKVGEENMDRVEWLKKDIETIQQTINLLLSSDKEKNKDGMTQVSNILPFLLIGGFSQSEVIAYLKAKQEAAKQVLSEMEKKEEDEDSKVEVQRKEEQKPKHMTAEAEATVPLEESPIVSSDVNVDEPEEHKNTNA